MADNKNIEAKFKAVPVPDKPTKIDQKNSITKKLVDDEVLTTSVDMSAITTLTQVTDDREKLYTIFDEMCADTLISSALDIYADNATEYNSDNKVLWVTSDNRETEQLGNRLIEQFGLNESAWSDIWALCKYGDLYYETFRKSETEEKKVGKQNLLDNSHEIDDDKTMLVEDVVVNIHKEDDVLDEYIQRVVNPANIFDLQKRGKTVGYIKTPNVEQARTKYTSYSLYQYKTNEKDTELYDGTKFVHISLSNPASRGLEQVQLFMNNDAISSAKTKKERNKITESYTYDVKRGKSIFYDIYKSYRELKLLEDSVLLSRLTKSSIVRVLGIEVGQAGKTQTQQVMQRVKQMVEQKAAFDVEGGLNEYNAPNPIENIIYVPIRDGKGGITPTQIGGDVNVGQLTDLDFFNNKIFAGLKVPKPFLGYMDDNAGFSGGESLAKVSSSFAKTIKRIQNAYTIGIKTLLNIFFLDKGLGSKVNTFEVHMVSPSTIEDNERKESLSSSVDIVNNAMNMFNDVEKPSDKLKLLKVLLKEHFSSSELEEQLQKIIDEMEKKPEEDNKKDINKDLEGVKNDLTHREKPTQTNSQPSTPQEQEMAQNEPENDVLPSVSELNIDLADNDAVNQELGGEE